MLKDIKNNQKLQNIRMLPKFFSTIIYSIIFASFLKTTAQASLYVSKKTTHENLNISDVRKEKIEDILKRIDSYMRKGRYIAATRLTKKAITLFPNRKEINPILATVMALGKQTSKAELIIRRSSGITLEYSSYKYIARALIALERRDIEKSENFAQQAIKIDPSNPLSYDTLGMVFLRKNRLSDAKKKFRQSINVEPGFSVGYSKLGAISLKSKRAHDAIRYYRISAKLDPENEKVFYGMAKASLMLGKEDDGKKFLNKTIELNKGFSPAYIKLSDIYFEAGEYSESYDYGKKLLSIHPEGSAGAFLIARALSQMGKDKEALPYANIVLKETPNNIPSLNIQGYSYIALQRYDDALKSFSKVDLQNFLFPISYIQAVLGNINESEAILESLVKEKGLGKLAHFLLAQLAIINGKYEEAAKHLEKSSGFISGFTMKNVNIKTYLRKNRTKRLKQFLCALYMFKKRFGKAKKLALDVIKSNPNDFIALYILGNLENFTGGDSFQYFEKALNIEPSFIPAHIELGYIYTHKKDYQNSINHYEVLAKAFPQRPEVQYKLGLSYYKAGSKQKAFDFFMHMLKEFPYFAPIHNQLALISMKLQPKQAIKWARQAGKLFPKSGQIQDTIGWIYFTKGDYKNCRKHLKRALALTTNSPTIYYHLAMVYKEQGMKEEAINLFKKAIAISRDFPEKESCKENIQNY